MKFLPLEMHVCEFCACDLSILGLRVQAGRVQMPGRCTVPADLTSEGGIVVVFELEAEAPPRASLLRSATSSGNI